jgi:hypothetical protein
MGDLKKSAGLGHAEQFANNIREGQTMDTNPKAVQRQIRESLGLPAVPSAPPTVPIEGHVCDFPIWSYSKKRSTITTLTIRYEDDSYVIVEAPRGMPGPTFPGYLDCILFYGQRDLFVQESTQISVYSMLKTLGMDPNNGGNYSHFHRDMRRAFALTIETDRFRDPATGTRSHVDLFRVLRRMRLAKHRQGVSTFYFDDLFLASLRAGYLKRVDFEFCLYLDKQDLPLARFLYSHVLKRLGAKTLYQRNLPGFLNDVGLGYLACLPPSNRNQKVKQALFPALDTLRGQAYAHWELDTHGNLFFISK